MPRAVIDKTGFTGLFDYHLDFNIGPQAARPRKTIRTASDRLDMVTAALQKLGLKLEPGKATAGFIVTDHVERPSEN